MVVSTCSFKLNGPGFNENDQLVAGILRVFSGRDAAMSFPSGSTTIWAEIDVKDKTFWRYPKNWFKNARKIQARIPKTHVRNVKHGSVGSSVIGTVRRTSSIGESFTSSAEQATKIIYDDSLLKKEMWKQVHKQYSYSLVSELFEKKTSSPDPSGVSVSESSFLDWCNTGSILLSECSMFNQWHNQYDNQQNLLYKSRQQTLLRYSSLNSNLYSFFCFLVSPSFF